MPCQQLRLPLLKRLADFQMSAVAKALVTSSNWKVGRWEVRTFQELWVSIDWGYPKIIIFLRGDFPYTNHFGDLPWKPRKMSEKYVGKGFLEIMSTVVNLLGTLVGIFFHSVYFVLKSSLKGTLPQIPKNMPLPQHLLRRSGLWSRLGQTQNLYNTVWSYHVAIVGLAPGEEDADKFYIIVKGGVRWLLRNFPFVAWTLNVLAVLLAVFLGAKICACCMLASKSCIKWGTGTGPRVPNCFPIITWSTQHFIVFKPATQSCALVC